MKIDHITFVAKSLAQANVYAQRHFGVALQRGGEHPLMGTHNLLARIAPDVFLEFIAINPEAAPPARSRWFALDRLNRDGVLDESPKLFGWVASCSNLLALETQLAPQKVLQLARDDLRWHFTVRDDGEAEMQGLSPHLIDWAGGKSPVERMADVGIQLKELTIGHPRHAELNNQLVQLGWNNQSESNQCVRWVTNTTPALHLKLQTPKGEVEIAGGGL